MTGMPVPPAMSRPCTPAIEQPAHGPARRGRMGHAARATALEHFGLDRYVCELAGHLREIATDHGEVVR